MTQRRTLSARDFLIGLERGDDITNVTVADALTLDYTHLVTLPQGLIVRQNMHLYRSGITQIPTDLIVCGSLHIAHSNITSLPKDLVVGRNLNIAHTKVTHLPAGLTVGGDLIMDNTKVGYLPPRLTVGGCLYTTHLHETWLPKDAIVGGTARINGEDIETNRMVAPPTWRNGKYMLVDRILMEITKHRGNVYHAKFMGMDIPCVIVTDGTLWAHGDSLQEAKESLRYKAARRDTSRYKNTPLDTVMAIDDAVLMYRAITGACAAGVRQFIASLPERKDAYTVQEVLTLSKGQYGHDEFAEFVQTK